MSSLNLPVDEALSRRFVGLAREGARVHDHIRHPPIEPEPNSDLDRLNRAYPKERASDWAWEFLQAARDHDGLLASSLSDKPDRAGHIHTALTNTLFRGAMEGPEGPHAEDVTTALPMTRLPAIPRPSP